ncbi:hypothetical protein PRVXT_002759 [Proteinivorax tanatarense]|uniref:Spore coat protein n=1 Tax=Proteinivorax tanatarense TaxID=1260629 RepID=A0AAU7VLE3_9FIRM
MDEKNSKELLKEKLKEFGPNQALVDILVTNILKKYEVSTEKANKITEEQKEQIRRLAIEYLSQLEKFKEEGNKKAK